MDMPFLKKYEKEIYLCATCRDGACGILCPIFETLGFESSTPRGAMRIARGLLEGRLELTEPLIKKIYTCTDCGYCATRCSNNPHDVMRALRADLVKVGKAHPYAAYTFESYIKDHTPAFRPHEERFNWLPEELRAPRKADVLFFVGCFAAHHTQWMAKTVVKILDRLGVKWTTLGLDEWCCGEVAAQNGLQNLSDMFAKHNANAINRAVKNLGVSRVICQCSGCSYTLKSYPERFGLTLDAEVLHVTELYSELIKEGKLKFKESKKAYVYQDACLLGRWQGVYEAPREIIRAIPGAKLVEMEPRTRDLQMCCTGTVRRWGATAGYHLPAIKYYRDFSKNIVGKRLKAAKESGAETLVSSCGGCHRSFVGGRYQRVKREGIDLRQISTLVADLMI